ncbi:MAG: hypothetical protein ACOZCP_04435 [Pseudomonadota bacterium]
MKPDIEVAYAVKTGAEELGKYRVEHYAFIPQERIERFLADSASHLGVAEDSGAPAPALTRRRFFDAIGYLRASFPLAAARFARGEAAPAPLVLQFLESVLCIRPAPVRLAHARTRAGGPMPSRSARRPGRTRHAFPLMP